MRRPVTGCIPVQSSVPAPWWPYDHMTPSDTALRTPACVACERACYVASIVYDSSTLWTVACQSPMSTGFSRQESWTGLPCPPPGDLPGSDGNSLPGSNPRSLLSPASTGGFFTTSTACGEDSTRQHLLTVLARQASQGTLRKPTSRAAAAASPGSPQKHSFSGSTAVLREPKLRGRAQHTVSTSLQVLLMYNPCGPHYLTLTTLPGREGTIIGPISQMRKTKVREVTKLTVATQVASGVTFSSYQRKEGVTAW